MRNDLAVCGFLLLAIACVFGQTLRHDFVNYDDGKYVGDNQQVARGLTAEGFGWAFTSRHASNWHPLTWLSHMLDCQVYGLRPWGHHLTNVLLHAATAILLFLILRRTTGDFWPSALAATVFAIHPLRVESVAWVAERKDVLSGLFFMLTLAAYLGYVRRSFSFVRYLAMLAFFALGLMAKPMLVMLPIVLLLLDYWPLGRMTATPRQILGLVAEKIPLLAMAAASCAATLWAQSNAISNTPYVSVPFRLGNAAVSCVAYLGQLFYPANLAALYPHPGANLPAWKIAGALLILTAISAAVVAWRRQCPYLLMGWLWYLVMLLPVIGLVQVGLQAMADRYTYLTQIGPCVGLIWMAAQLVRSRRWRGWKCGVVAAAAVAALLGCAWRQTAYWRDSETLWNRALACTEQNAIAHYNLGVALAKRDPNQAIEQYQKALAIQPDCVEVHYNLGALLAKQGHIDEAIFHYRQAVAAAPELADAHNNLGLALLQCGQAAEAAFHFQTALGVQSGHADLHNNLGSALIHMGRFHEAIACCSEAIRLKPDSANAHNNLGIALQNCGRLDEAIACFQKALEIDPSHADARKNLEFAQGLH